MVLTIEIDLVQDAAHGENPELVLSLLREYVNKIQETQRLECNLYDINGNRVGTAFIVEN
jgi:hypothetical protein